MVVTNKLHVDQVWFHLVPIEGVWFGPALNHHKHFNHRNSRTELKNWRHEMNEGLALFGANV
jgi:hypothetical protein